MDTIGHLDHDGITELARDVIADVAGFLASHGVKAPSLSEADLRAMVETVIAYNHGRPSDLDCLIDSCLETVTGHVKAGYLSGRTTVPEHTGPGIERIGWSGVPGDPKGRPVPKQSFGYLRPDNPRAKKQVYQPYHDNIRAIDKATIKNPTRLAIIKAWVDRLADKYGQNQPWWLQELLANIRRENKAQTTDKAPRRANGRWHGGCYVMTYGKR